MRTSVAPEAGGRPLPARPLTFRGDIEGLRAVAVMLVLIDHAGLPLTGGFVGVDVFFVISGFLITSLLVTELVTTRTISLRAFYARRARRLLPAAATVLVVTGLLTMLLVPKTRWSGIGYDILASGFYIQNWRLAGLAVDYQAQDVAVSPLQHFWSLGVEEQYYLIWPLLLLLIGAVLARFRTSRSGPPPPAGADPGARRRTVALTLGIALVAVPSFAWSLWYTAENPAGAYFVTTTRLWELAVGGAVAIFAGRLTALPPRWATVLGWAGLATVVACAVLYTRSTAFPGVAALGPVLGTAAVLAGGQVATSNGPRRVLETGPMRWVGALSYSLYLWHWPMLVLAAAVFGSLSPLAGLVVVGLSFLPAYLSFRYVEDPIRRAARFTRDPNASLVLGGMCTMTAVATSFVLLVAVWPPPPPFTSLPVTLSSEGDDARAAQPRGAMVLAADPRDDPAGAPVATVPTIYPTALQARNDIGANFCSTSLADVEVRTCVAGDTSSTVDVALIGDSHAQQWTTPLSAVARERGWRLTMYTKSACPFVDEEVVISVDGGGVRGAARPYTECTAWRDRVLDLLTGDGAPDMIIVSSGEHLVAVDGVVQGRERSTGLMTEGFQRIWQRFVDQGTRVVAIADTPSPGRSVPDCVAANPENLVACAFSRAESDNASGSSLVAATSELPDVTLIDLNDAICPTERCAAVIGGVLVWRDSSHLSATYAGTLAPRLDDRIPPIP